jgi:hypothetical protein
VQADGVFRPGEQRWVAELQASVLMFGEVGEGCGRTERLFSSLKESGFSSGSPLSYPGDLGTDLDGSGRNRPKKESRRHQKIGIGHLSAKRLQGDGEDVATEGLAMQSVPSIGDSGTKCPIINSCEGRIFLKCGRGLHIGAPNLRRATGQ